MSKQKGIIKLVGNIGGMSFYTSNGEYLARTAGGPTKERIATGSNFVRTRENNAEFGEIYQYFTTRQKNPLKGKQAIIAAGCKLIRVFYAILKRGVDYDPQKLRMDIIRPELEAA